MAHSGAWAIHGKRSGELLTFQGAVLWHNNKMELEWLFPKQYASGAYRSVELPTTGIGRPIMRLADHPDMQAVRFPLDPAEFRESR